MSAWQEKIFFSQHFLDKIIILRGIRLTISTRLQHTNREKGRGREICFVRWKPNQFRQTVFRFEISIDFRFSFVNALTSFPSFCPILFKFNPPRFFFFNPPRASSRWWTNCCDRKEERGKRGKGKGKGKVGRVSSGPSVCNEHESKFCR